MEFRARFSPFAGLTFINCFSAVMAHLEEMDSQEAFFWFDSMCGRSALRCRCDGEMSQWQKRICEYDFYDGGVAENIDFLFGLAGYEYRVIDNPAAFCAETSASIGENRPVIAKIREDGFCVIIGVEEGKIVCPDFADAQACPASAPQWEDVECLYRIGNKTAPEYSPVNGMVRIVHVLQESIDGDFWDGFKTAITAEMTCAERANVMNRIADAMWHTFNCHNLAEVFRARKFANLSDKRFDYVCQKIDEVCTSTHDLAWSIIELNRCVDWTKPASKCFGGMVALTLDQLRKNDVMLFTLAYQAVCLLKKMEDEFR